MAHFTSRFNKMVGDNFFSHLNYKKKKVGREARIFNELSNREMKNANCFALLAGDFFSSSSIPLSNPFA